MYIQIIYMSAFTRVWTWELVLLCVCICLFAESLNTRRFPLPLICRCCWKKKICEPSWSFDRWKLCLFFSGQIHLQFNATVCRWKWAELDKVEVCWNCFNRHLRISFIFFKKKLQEIVTDIGCWVLRLLSSGKCCCCCSLVSRSVKAALIANSEWNCCIAWLLQRVMSSQSVVTLFAQTWNGRSGFVCASSFSPAGRRKIWSDCFSREKKKLMLPHKHYDLKMSLQRKRRRKPKRPLFFLF